MSIIPILLTAIASRDNSILSLTKGDIALELIDIENETFTNSGYSVTLAVRQGIELLLPNLDGGLEPRVFLEYHQGQIRLQVWDELLDPHVDEPITFVLKTISTPEQKETVPF